MANEDIRRRRGCRINVSPLVALLLLFLTSSSKKNGGGCVAFRAVDVVPRLSSLSSHKHDYDIVTQQGDKNHIDFIGDIVRSTVLAASLAATSLSIALPSFATDIPTTSTSSFAAAGVSPHGAPPAYDETWNLVRKFALDRSYNGQNWDEAYA